MPTDRKLVQDCFIRVCRDSGFTVTPLMAADLAAKMAKTHPLLVWASFPSFDVMQEIAAGTHPAVSNGDRQ